ncbi:hypothetical protein J2W42_005458 [Rhizobium tibeticum]|uniref:hypothetical protein n=1 Tax=Rhizobium tibeticum TaxID=501024 RepID=UPI002782296C|nr:hypothetical protein [Rhizobium tibeticum]MDP9812588.1 hypothetical protein [Rhizobium tibeticum]
MKVAYYIAAWSGESEAQMRGRINVLNCVSGIRDLLFWQCEYKVTVEQLIQGATLQIEAARKTMDGAKFTKFRDETPLGDMVFASLNNEAFYGKPKPCSN